MFLNGCNELVKTARLLDNASKAEQLVTMASLGTFVTGVGAAFTMISVLSNAHTPSELETVVKYLDQRLDVIEEKLDILSAQQLRISRKLNVLLEGQRAITEIVLLNSRGVAATRLEVGLVRQAVRHLDQKVSQIYDELDHYAAAEARERRKYFDEYVAIRRAESLRGAAAVTSNWLNPKTGIIDRVNRGDFDRAFLDRIQAEKQGVVTLIEGMAG